MKGSDQADLDPRHPSRKNRDNCFFWICQQLPGRIGRLNPYGNFEIRQAQKWIKIADKPFHPNSEGCFKCSLYSRVIHKDPYLEYKEFEGSKFLIPAIPKIDPKEANRPEWAKSKPQEFLDSKCKNPQAWQDFKKALEDGINEAEALRNDPPRTIQTMEEYLSAIALAYDVTIGFEDAVKHNKKIEARGRAKINMAIRQIIRKRTGDLRKYGKHTPAPFLKIEDIKTVSSINETKKPHGRPRKKAIRELARHIWEIISDLPWREVSTKPKKEEIVAMALRGLLNESLSPKTIRNNLYR